MTYTHNGILYSALKKKRKFWHIEQCEEPEDIILNEKDSHEKTNTVWFYLHEVPKEIK